MYNNSTGRMWLKYWKTVRYTVMDIWL